MRTMWLIAGAIAGAILMPPAGIAQAPPPLPRPQTTRPSAAGVPADVDFVKRAAEGGMKEVEAGKVAAEKAASAEVKAFAQKMVEDHTKANDELMNLTRETAPRGEKSARDETAAASLTAMSGPEFDRAYMAEMVRDHEMTVTLFEQEAAEGKTEALKSWAAQKLPTLRMHLQMARTLHAKLGAGAPR